MFDRVFNIAAALVACGVLAYGLASGQKALIALGGVAVGGWAARLRWGPRSYPWAWCTCTRRELCKVSTRWCGSRACITARSSSSYHSSFLPRHLRQQVAFESRSRR